MPDTHRTFSALWERAVREHAERPFLVFLDAQGTRNEWSYGSFHDRVERVAGALSQAGVRAGDPVHVALKNSPAFIAIWLAAARLGAWIVSVDPASAARDIASQLSRTGARVGVYGAERAAAYRAGSEGALDRAFALREDATDLLDGAALLGAPAAAVPVAADTRLALMFTSGTTSAPKGVILTQGNYHSCARAMSEIIALGPEDRWFVTLPLFHANAQFYCFNAAIAVGGSVALTSTFSASGWFTQARDLAVTHASLFAAPIRMILARRPEDAPRLALRHLWFAQSLGEEHFQRFAELIGVAPRQLYGMTETLAVVTADLSAQPGPDVIGTPVLSRAVRLLDPDTGAEVAEGEPGIITVAGTRGIDLFEGYLDDPVKTEAAFQVRDGRTWFSTGDLAQRTPDGSYRFVGRVDDVIKVSGENVSLTEIEAVLAQAPGVFEVAVLAEADPVRDTVPVAYVVPRDPASPPDLDALAAWAGEHLAPSARPRAWHLIEDLPRTSVGKVRRFKLSPALSTTPSGGTP
ncbi:class I adenylate-forming enzyme family protein [Leucobacter sp. M11]|uniref:class I adenylate-forming enzyme family protein n=1 Tax=Leucobacter sp. M11 TaxID=2993565 RepID=UPI002D7EA7D6|nr:class I adenylate-forming enzyme family protein [Leucobacter sp. M11]MEB4616594.1 class I adenylate-forming enzyme family protein [Leucobacter sp. M11]